MNFYLLIAFYVVVCGLGVGIFLWGKPDGNSMFDRLYRLVCVHVPWAMKTVLEKCFGKRGPAALDAAWTYVCYTSNPIVQIFYLGVVVGGYLTFVGFGYPHLPNRLVGSIHKYTGFAVFSVCVGVWWRACTTDPGTVTPLNVDDLCKLYVWDDIIFEKASCKTCGQLKPARSKHCSLCNVCVARFDHHCIWLNNCVGVGNHKWFLTFLFSHLVLCFYGMAMGTVIVYDIVQRKDLLSAVFVDPVTRQKHPATYLIVLQYMLATEAMVIFVALLCLVMGLVLCGFFIWHLNLVRTGVTTNELNKWNFVKWQLRHEGEDQKAKELTNIYNKGLRENFREVFFNVDVHQLPGRQAVSRAAPSNSIKEERASNKSGGGGKKGKSKKN